jgi:hypothetical protein
MKVNTVTVSGTTATIGTAVDTSLSASASTYKDLLQNPIFINSTRARYSIIVGSTLKEYSLSGANLSFAATVTLLYNSDVIGGAFYDSTSDLLTLYQTSSVRRIASYKYSSYYSNTYVPVHYGTNLNWTNTGDGNSGQVFFTKLSSNTLFVWGAQINSGTSGCCTYYVTANMGSVVTTPTSNLNLGIPYGTTNTSYTNGQTATVIYLGSGNYSNVFSGLIPAYSYYFDNTNTIGTTSVLSNINAVRALTTTTLVF